MIDEGTEAHDPAGHAEHFLQRLDRLDGEQVELALLMYREHEVVAAVLEKLPASRGTQRVAFALAPAEAPPYVLVTHEGRFVTCLGAGMLPTGCHVVTFARFIELLARLGVENNRLRLWRERKGQGDPVRRLVASDGWIAREDISAVLATQPLMELSYGRSWIETVAPLVAHTKVLLRNDKKSLRARVPDADLRAYWRAFRSMGHLGLVATAVGGHEFASALEASNLHTLPPWHIALASRVPYVALQALNAAARLGRSVVPLFKRGLAAAPDRISIVAAALPLAAIGVRHPSLTAEVRKALESSGPPGAPNYPLRAAVRPTLDALISLTLDDERTEARKARMCVEGAKIVSGALDELRARGGPLPLPPAYSEEGDLFERDQRAVAVNSAGPFDDDVSMVKYLLVHTGWAARAEVEDFYAAEEVVKLLAKPWSPEDVWPVVEGIGEEYAPRAHAPVQAQPKPGRNDPCSCGSGKKYKKCCGA